MSRDWQPVFLISQQNIFKNQRTFFPERIWRFCTCLLPGRQKNSKLDGFYLIKQEAKEANYTTEQE